MIMAWEDQVEEVEKRFKKLLETQSFAQPLLVMAVVQPDGVAGDWNNYK